MRTILAHIEWNDKMKNKTATESWNILKSELDSVINRYVIICSYEKATETVPRRNICKKRLSKRLYIVVVECVLFISMNTSTI